MTSAYRKKLEELKEAEEVEKREEYLENIGDVMKQQDLSGFYRHLYEQKMAPGDAATKDASVSAEAKTSETPKKKNYRKRKSSADQNEVSDKEEASASMNASAEKAHLPCNLDADSDFSIDSSSSDSENDKKPDNQEQSPAKAESTEAQVPQNGSGEAAPKLEDESPVELPKPKIDIWKKRTVGEAFDQALERYYQRKAEREQAA